MLQHPYSPSEQLPTTLLAALHDFITTPAARPPEKQKKYTNKKIAFQE